MKLQRIPIPVGALLFVAVLLGQPLQAQHGAPFSLFGWNQMNWNPAYAGLDHSLSVTGQIRSQWQGIADNPETQQLNLHAPVYFLQSGVGLLFENDVLGASEYLRLGLNYSYHLDLGNSVLALGIGAEQVQRSLDGSRLRTPDGTYLDDVALDHADGILPTGQVSGRVLNFSAGAYFTSEQFQAGVAVRNVAEPVIDLETTGILLPRQFFVFASYDYDLGSSFRVTPAVQLSMMAGSMQSQAGLMLHYNENLSAGASYRGYGSTSNDAIAVLLGVKLSENIRLGYAYDAGLSGLSNVHRGSHEILINYNLNKRILGGRLPKIIYNPRSL